MEDDSQFYDFAEFLQKSNRGSTSTLSSSSTIPWGSTSTPATSPPSSDREPTTKSAANTPVRLELSPLVVSFTKGSRLFKIKYNVIEVHRDPVTGFIRCIEVSDSSSLSGPFIHTFITARRPIPHLEEPATNAQKCLRVSFLEEQMVQVAQTIFPSQPHYTFSKDSDCTRFQEAILGFSIIFVAGIAEITSKGRGEEAISQNLRVCKYNNDNLHILYFANSQRKEKRRYIAIPTSAIEDLGVPKKIGKPITLRLASDNDTTAHLKTLNIVFLENVDVVRFTTLLQTVGVK